MAYPIEPAPITTIIFLFIISINVYYPLAVLDPDIHGQDDIFFFFSGKNTYLYLF